MDHPLIAGLIGGWLAALVTGWAANSVRRIQADREGWRTLAPGPAIWAALVGSAAFSLLLFYVYLFVGSARADAQEQMFYCLLLATAFAAGSVVVAYSAFSQTVSWRGPELRIRPLVGPMVTKHLADLDVIQYRPWAGMVHMTFADDYVLKLSPQMRGVNHLLDHIERGPEDGQLPLRLDAAAPPGSTLYH